MFLGFLCPLWPPLQFLISKCVFALGSGKEMQKTFSLLSSEVTWAVLGRTCRRAMEERKAWQPLPLLTSEGRNAGPCKPPRPGPASLTQSCLQRPSAAHSGLLNSLALLPCVFPSPVSHAMPCHLACAPFLPTCLMPHRNPPVCSAPSLPSSQTLFLATDPRSLLEAIGPRPTGRDRVRYRST